MTGGMWSFAVLAILQAGVSAQSRGPASDSLPAPHGMFHGFQGQTNAEAPRIEDAEIEVDGHLDEAVWARAAILTGFSQYSPVDGRAAEDSTDVLVWYSPYAIHFGIQAYEPHGTVNATLADRDKIDGDDRVEILLDTFNDNRLALSFGVNPLGIQADGFRSNAPIARVDLTTDFVFESKGRLTDYGYEVEIRIPFKSIRFQSQEVQDWGLNVIRSVQHSGHENTWTRARQGSGPLVAQSGKLSGLTDLRRGLVLDVNPFVVGKVNGSPAAASATGWSYDAVPEAGFNVRWGATSNLAVDLTYNADFSQVEADAGQIPEDVRFAVQFPEKRPFFLDGIEKFDAQNRLIYTRQITDPVAAARVTGKLSGVDIGFVSAIDGKSTSTTGDSPIHNMLRIRRDIGTQSFAGIVYTDKIDGSAYNRVAAADIHLVRHRANFWILQNAWMFNRTATGVTTRAPLFETAFDCTGQLFGCRYGVKAIHPDFRSQSGFVPRSGQVDVSTINRVTLVEGRRGAFMEKLNIYWRTNWIWPYRDFSLASLPPETRFTFTVPMSVRGGWSVTPGGQWRTYEFPQASYEHLRVERTLGAAVDTIPYLVPAPVNDVWIMQLQVTSPEFPRFSFDLNVQGGKDVNFTEPDRSSFLLASVSADLRPTSQVRATTTYDLVRRNRERDGTRFSTQHVARVKLEYQLSRPIFFRFVGQYTVDERAALIDPATGFPLLQRNNAGAYVWTTAQAVNDLEMDWLFSYRPSPGTVLFFGYGSDLTEPDPFQFRDLERARDGFFIKLSYLFRV
ncbi:MAG: carbohydrate binding family 9 domain-containing protein [Longimicrobiales bacterium]